MLGKILEKMTIEILFRMTSLIRHFEYYHIWQKIGNAVYFDNIKYYYLKFSGMLDNILDNISYIHTAFKSYFLLESLYVKLLLDIVEYIFYMIEVWTPWWYVKRCGTNTF